MRWCRKLNLPGRQDASLFNSGFRRLFAKLLLRNWDEGGVRAWQRKEFKFLSQLPFSFPRKEPEYILVATCDLLQELMFPNAYTEYEHLSRFNR